MIAVIILMILVIVNYVKNMSLVNTALFDEQDIKTDNNCLAEIAGASIISIAAFIIYSLFNDSMVTVNPIFWLFLGINVSTVYGVRLLKNK